MERNEADNAEIKAGLGEYFGKALGGYEYANDAGAARQSEAEHLA